MMQSRNGNSNNFLGLRWTRHFCAFWPTIQPQNFCKLLQNWVDFDAYAFNIHKILTFRRWFSFNHRFRVSCKCCTKGEYKNKKTDKIFAACEMTVGFILEHEKHFFTLTSKQFYYSTWSICLSNYHNLV